MDKKHSHNLHSHYPFDACNSHKAVETYEYMHTDTGGWKPEFPIPRQFWKVKIPVPSGNENLLFEEFPVELQLFTHRNQCDILALLSFVFTLKKKKKLHWWGTGLVSELLKKPSWPQINSEHWYYLGLEFLEFPGSYLCLSCGLLTGNKIIFLSSPASFLSFNQSETIPSK